MDLDDDYRRAGFSGRLGWGGRPAVLAVDICRAYTDPDSPLYAAADPALASMVRIVTAGRRGGHPVVHTRVRYQPDGADGGLFFAKVPALSSFVAGNPLGDWNPSLVPAEGEMVVTKQYASAFFATSLAPYLTAKAIDTVVIIGFSTSGCVRASAVDAVSHGFRPMVVGDACGDRDPRPHEASLFDLSAKYADVVGEQEAVEHLQKGPAC